MLLRIDVYPSKFQVTDLHQPLPPSPTPPLYACLATASASGGVLITAGRGPQADVCLLKDKSVSREHLLLRLISKHASHQQDLLHDETSVVLAKSAMAPRNADEQAACDQSDDGMCVVLENMGKFGSLVVIPKPLNAPKKDNDNDDDDDDTGNDETDDEQDKPGGAVKSESQVAEAVLQPRKHDIDWKRLGPNESAVLYDLSGSKSITMATTTAVQCGQNGATLVITKLYWNMVWSGVPPAVMNLWNDRLYSFGATTSEDIVKSDMTHLITADGLPTAKLLTAWCYQTPIVSVEFLHAMIQRQRPSDPLPDEKQFLPVHLTDRSWWKQHTAPPNPKLWSAYTLLSGCASNNGMEGLARAAGATVIPLYDVPVAEALKTTQELVKQQTVNRCFGMNPGTPKTKLFQMWKRLKVQVLTSKDVANKITEQQALTDDVDVDNDNAAGKVGKPKANDAKEDNHDDEEKDAASTVKTTSARKPPASRSAKAASKETTTTKSSKRDDEEEPEKKSSSRSKRATPSRGAAKKASKEEPHVAKDDEDDHDDDDAASVPPTASQQQQRASRSTSSATKKPQTPAKKTSSKASVAATPAATARSQPETKAIESPAEEKDDPAFPDDPDDVPMDSPKKSINTKSRSASQSKEEVGSVPTPQDKKKTAVADASSSARKRRNVDADADSVQESTSKKAKTTKKDGGKVLEAIAEETKSKRKRNNKDGDDDESGHKDDDEAGHKDNKVDEKETKVADRRSVKKQKQEAPRQGWYVAAPQGTRQRKAFRQSFEEAHDDDGDGQMRPPIATAVTEARADLIVIRQPGTTSQQSAPTAATTSTTNFKRFRKNIIMRRGDHTLVQLQSVLPKETPLLRELEEQQLMLDEVKRTADAFFHDGTAKAAKKATAGKKDNSILSYMQKKKPVATKRGRGKTIVLDDDDDGDLDI